MYGPARFQQRRPPAYQNLPKFWRSKISEATKLNARLIHWDLVTRFTSATATISDLWDWIETGFTYAHMMQLLIDDGLEFEDDAIRAINAQITAYDSVIERLRRTGKAGFSGNELATARAAATVMDSLLDLDRNGIADKAGRWSAAQMHSLRATGNLSRKKIT